MKKFFLFFLPLVFYYTSSYSQNRDKFCLNAGIDIGHTANVDLFLFWGPQLGVSVQGEYSFLEKLSGTVSIGYSTYLGVSVAGGDKQPAVNMFFVRAGGKYYIYKDLYLGAEAGMGNLSGGGNIAAVYLELKGTSFTYSPQIGYQFKIKNKKQIDISVKYEVYNKFSPDFRSVCGRIAYIF